MVHFPVASRNRGTLTATKRGLFPARYARKDARNLVLRLTYGPQSNSTGEVIERAGLAGGSGRDLTPSRQTIEKALPLTGYDPVRCRRLLEDFDRLKTSRSAA